MHFGSILTDLEHFIKEILFEHLNVSKFFRFVILCHFIAYLYKSRWVDSKKVKFVSLKSLMFNKNWKICEIDLNDFKPHFFLYNRVFYVILIILQKKLRKMFISSFFRLILGCKTVKLPILGINMFNILYLDNG